VHPLLILASSSPRRRDLLRQAGFSFETITPRSRERSDENLTLRELTGWNAIRKGLEIARAYPDAVVLSADTLIALDGTVIGKPSNEADARRILRRLSGREHEVCSSVFVGYLAVSRTMVWPELSTVRFKELSEQAILEYLATINPMDKAGAYAAQGGDSIIERISGSYTNVVGLPMERTVPTLADFGIVPLTA
jgi:septum formation protein